MELLIRRLSQTPTITAGAYSANDAVGGLLTFKDAALLGGAGTGAILDSVTIIDKAKQSIQLDLILFDRTFTATADNDAFDPTDADLANCIGGVKITDWFAFNDNSMGCKTGIGLPIRLADAGDSLFGQLVTRGAPTYAATTDLIVILGIVRG